MKDDDLEPALARLRATVSYHGPRTDEAGWMLERDMTRLRDSPIPIELADSTPA